MRKTTNKVEYFIDTYELGLDDLEWGLGYSPDKYNSDIDMKYAIEYNLFNMIQELHFDASVICVENKWVGDNKLVIKFEIRKAK